MSRQRQVAIAIAKCCKVLEDSEFKVLTEYIFDLENLLFEADEEDFFGTEGWRHRLGVDE